MTEAGQPTIDELQKTVADLVAERDKIKTDLDTARAWQTQFDEMKSKYDEALQVNMALIRRLPTQQDSSDVGQTRKSLDDVKRTPIDERKRFLKEYAVKCYEKEKV